MRIYSLCVVKNEADIIAQCLDSAVSWCDFIYVLDNGSADGTWEIVLDLADKYPSIVPYGRDERTFQPSFRSVLFHHYGRRASPGDWWCRLDADEFYIDNPKQFLRSVPRNCHVVWSSSFTFYFTDKDLERYHEDPSLYADDVPIDQKCRYYLNNWSERRFVRHRDDLNWNPDNSWPVNAGNPYPHRIRLKHFQWRSPQQIRKRLETRRTAVSQGCSSFNHERALNWAARVFDKSSARISSPNNKISALWQDRIVNADNLDFHREGNDYISRDKGLPRIKGLQKSRVDRVVTRIRSCLTTRFAN